MMLQHASYAGSWMQKLNEILGLPLSNWILSRLGLLNAQNKLLLDLLRYLLIIKAWMKIE